MKHFVLFCLWLSITVTQHVTANSSKKGGWGGWSEWSSWGKGLCAGNQRVKTRACTNPLPSSSGEYCDGDNVKQESGSIDGGLSEWSQWSTCEKPCGGSIVNRTRQCDNPPPSRGGAPCSDSMIETKLECIMKCPEGRTDGAWSPWSDWTKCPSTCTKNGGAMVTRFRQCIMPPPMFGGSPCPGNATEKMLRCFDVCPLDGGFGQWSEFTECSKTCGSGLRHRRRYCNNPEPRGDTAKNCTGSFTETRHCKLVECVGAVNGSWANWNSWSTCTEKTLCNKGKRTRKRTCTNPVPNKGGDDCHGNGEVIEVCPVKNCKDDRPTPPPTLPVQPGDYIHRECGQVKLKYIGSSAPKGVLNVLNFQRKKFEGGYYGVVEEERGNIKKYCFEPFPAMTIKEAADKVQSYRKTDTIPEYTKPTDESLPILGFSVRLFNDGSNALKGWDFGINEVYEYNPGNKVKINDVMFTYYSEGTHFGFLAKGKFRLFMPAAEFDVIVFRNGSFLDPVSSMMGQTASMSLKGLVDAIGLPDDLDGLAGTVIKAIKNLGIWDFTFSPVEIGYDFRHLFKSPFRVTATRKFNGIPLHMDVVYIHAGWDRKIAFGFTFDGESYGSVLEKMSSSGSVGKAVSGFLNAIGLQVEVGVAWCPSFYGSFRVTKSSRFYREPLKDLYKYEIPEGLTTVAQVSIPKDCRDSSFCNILKTIVGPKAKFRVAGVVKAGYYKLSGGFYKVRIYKDYSFHKLELYTEVNTTANKRDVGFKAEIKVPVSVGSVMVDGMAMERYLRFGGSIKHKIGSSDATGTLFMRGMWYHAFGLRWLNLGNMMISLTITFGSPTVVTSFALGGQLEFGNDCLYDADFAEDGHCLRIAVYFSAGKTTYFYGKISALTIGKLVRMCGGPTSLPGPVHSSGFPKGLRVQYNPSGKDADLRSSGGPLIQKGFRMKGVLNLLGYEIKAEIKYSDREIFIDGELDPINLGGHLVMSRNNTHKHVGPRLFFHFKRAVKNALIKLPFFKMYFEGYVKVLGIEASAYLNITMQQLEIYVWGKVWNLMYCELYISAGYDYTNIADAHFYIRVIVDLRGLTDAIEKARKSVDQAFKAAQKTLRDAIDKVKLAKQRCKEKLKIKCSNCYSLKCKQAEDNCKGFLDKAGKWIGGVINKAGRWIKNTARKIGDGLAKVGRAIKSFFKGWRRRRSLLEQRDEHFDIHIRNRRFISKFICEGIVGGGCRGVSHLCYGTCKAVDFIGQGLCSTLDIAVGALKLAEKATGWINSAIQFLLQMFLIHGIRFELGLGQQFNGFMVAAEIDLTLFGNRMYFGFAFDMKNPYRSISSAKDGSLYRYKQGVRQLRTEPTYNPYDRPNPYSDFDLAGTFGIEALQTGTENRLGSCIAALSGRDKDKLVLVGCNSTDERQRWTHTLKGSLINLHSKKCLILPNNDGSSLYQNNCEKDTTLQATECDVATRTLKLRRSNLCVESALSSRHGPGSLVHLGSLKCIHLAPSQKLVLRTGCNRVDTEFEINAAGHLIWKTRSLCARAESKKAVPGAKIELVNPSMGCDRFGFTKLGSLQHLKTGYCVQTPNREMIPKDFTELVLDRKCEYTRLRNSGASPDAQMTFAFVPKDNTLKMRGCSPFYDGRLNQRFAVMNEELHSVCSKYAVDVALNKIASQSSIKHNGFPSRAVDGDFNFQWEKGSCTHTKEETDPWWRVDLGREYIVTDVTIINRGDHGERLRNIQVHVGPQLMVRKNPVCHDRVRQAHDAEAIRLQCDPPIPGQFVGVQMYGKGILSMCEVIVASRLGGMADRCLVENGGCEQICNNDKCGKDVSCSCLPGYKLAYDRRTCLDINECLSNNGGCRADKQAYCVNYPGGFYCGCKKGYILKDDRLDECMDINECGVRNGGCEQMCNNTLGGYMCNCRKGYERKPNDPYGCQNVNECLQKNGGCDHTCFDYDGGHYCKCKPGFRLMEDGKSCEELYCSVLESPRWGAVSPSRCTKRFENLAVGTVCTTQCSKGHEISTNTISDTLTCRIDGTWNHASVSCHPVKCPILPRPKNGGLVPARCHDDTRGFNEFGQRCVAYCKHGYRVRGPSTKYCGADKKWSNEMASVECIEIIEPSYLNCPSDIEVELSPSQSWLTLGSLFIKPQTNINASRISMFPQNAGPNYKFNHGKTLVGYSATDEAGQMLACSFFVVVNDATPPIIQNCPLDIIKTSSNDREVIMWVEPKFVDNVGIRSIVKPYRKSGDVWRSGESARLQYIATDTSGNTQICSFKVSFKSILCPTLTSTSTTKIQPFQHRRRYSVICQQPLVRTLFGNYGFEGNTLRCQNGDYYLEKENIGTKTPECVGYVKSTASGVCKDGQQKFMHDSWLSGRQYYCADCPTGTSFNTTSKTCEKCRPGTYQDEQGMISCELCDIGASTKESGSNSPSDCIGLCPPGSYSESGFNEVNQPCLKCPIGSYSYLNGTTACISCPEKSTTSKEGATDEEQCLRKLQIIRTNPDKQTAGYEGGEIRIECFFDGKPLPQVTWTKVTGSLPPQTRIDPIYDITMSVIGSSMTLVKAKKTDAGGYRCSVQNGLGSDDRIVQVGVISKTMSG